MTDYDRWLAQQPKPEVPAVEITGAFPDSFVVHKLLELHEQVYHEVEFDCIHSASPGQVDLLLGKRKVAVAILSDGRLVVGAGVDSIIPL